MKLICTSIISQNENKFVGYNWRFPGYWIHFVSQLALYFRLGVFLYIYLSSLKIRIIQLFSLLCFGFLSFRIFHLQLLYTSGRESSNFNFDGAFRRGGVCCGIYPVFPFLPTYNNSDLRTVLMLEVWTVSANKAGKWQRGVLKAAERFMVEWHKDAADLCRMRHAFVVGGAQGNVKGRGNSREETAVDESRKETVDRVARYQADYEYQARVQLHVLLRLFVLPTFCGCFECDSVVLRFGFLFCIPFRC